MNKFFSNRMPPEAVEPDAVTFDVADWAWLRFEREIRGILQVRLIEEGMLDGHRRKVRVEIGETGEISRELVFDPSDTVTRLEEWLKAEMGPMIRDWMVARYPVEE